MRMVLMLAALLLSMAVTAKEAQQGSSNAASVVGAAATSGNAAREPAAPSAVSAPAPAATPTPELIYEVVKTERELLGQQADRHYQGIESQTNRMLALATGAVIVLGSLFYWFMGSSRKEFEKQIHETFDRETKEMIQREAAALRENLAGVMDQVKELGQFKSAHITWVMSEPDQERQAAVAQELRAVGVKRLSHVTPQPGAAFTVADAELVIVSYNGSDEAKRWLRVVVDELINRQPPVPLLVYTYSADGRPSMLAADDLAVLGRYMWYVPVNFPVQLIAQVRALARRPIAGV